MYDKDVNSEMTSLLSLKKEKELKILDLKSRIFLKNYERID